MAKQNLFLIFPLAASRMGRSGCWYILRALALLIVRWRIPRPAYGMERRVHLHSA
jgi:hypothetical protein